MATIFPAATSRFRAPATTASLCARPPCGKAKTSDQIAACVAAVFQRIEPVEKGPVVTAADRLAPYRKHILKQRRRGLSWDQIATGMRDPMTGEKVSGRTLREDFGEKPAKQPATPPRMRLILDPPPASRYRRRGVSGRPFMGRGQLAAAALAKAGGLGWPRLQSRQVCCQFE